MPELLKSLNDAFAGMELAAKDEPAMNLARLYAAKIENARDYKTVKDLGPELMKLLSELLMTPRARASINKLTVKEAANDSDTAATFAEQRGKRRRYKP